MQENRFTFKAMRLLLVLLSFLSMCANAQLRSDCIGCPAYPYGGTIIKTDSLNGKSVIPITFNGNKIVSPVDVEIKTTLIDLKALDSLIKGGIIHGEANRQYIEKDTIVLPALEWDGHKLENVVAVVMYGLPTTFILGQNAFNSLGTAFSDKYWPAFEFVLFKETPREVKSLDTGYLVRNKLNLFFKGVGLFDKQHYAEAIPYFKLYKWLHPDSIYGYHWLARALHAKQQFCHNKEAAAMYDETLKLALVDTLRFKSQGLEAASYLAIFFNNYMEDKGRTLTYLKQGLQFDSTNKTIIKTIAQLEAASRPKVLSGSHLPDYRRYYKGLQ